MREDEGVRVAPGGDARGDGAAVVADDERALTAASEASMISAGSFAAAATAAARRPSAALRAGNHLGRLGDGAGGGGAGGAEGVRGPAVRVHLVEKVHARRPRAEGGAEAPPAPRGGR